MVSASGLMGTARIAPIAKDFNVGNTVILATSLSVALVVERHRATFIRVDPISHCE
jgi:OFA family oxalate/formate antiporter-like MFS transporter